MKKFLSLLIFLTLACASKHPKVENEEKLKKIEEFDSAVRVEPAAPPPLDAPTAEKPPVAPIKKKTKKGAKTKTSAQPAVDPTIHQPDIEDPEGFIGRRPVKDPFRVGEKVTYTGRYFKMTAGKMVLKVDPFVQVNGKTAYQFGAEIRTASFFESIYSVDDKVNVLMDYDQMVPRAFSLHVKETKQVREARSLFDFDKMSATYWEKKVTEKSGVEEKRQQWNILPYSQNVFSAIFYMRLFKWETGKEYSFRVADDEQNLVFKGKAIRREVLNTDLGPMKSIVIQPQIFLRGALKPAGDIFIWLSDDDRKLVLRIEAKLSFGTLVFDVDSIKE
jgi:hypothetical protein